MSIQDVFNPMLDTIIDHIDRTRDDNELRYEYWKLMSNGNWANRDIEDLTTGACKLFLLELSRAGRNTDERQLLADVAIQWVLMDISDWIISNREISRQLPVDVLRECQRSADNLKYCKRDIEEAESRQDRGRERGGGRGWEQSRDREISRGRDSGRGRDGFRDSAFSSRGTPTTERRPISGLSAALEKKDSEQRGERTSRVEMSEARPVTPAPASEPAYVPRGRTTSKTNTVSTLDGPDYTLARPYDEFVIEGEIWKPAHLSKWSLPPEKGQFQNIRMAFNPRKQIPFHVKSNDNTIREEFRNMSADMDYMRHELSSTHRVRHTSPENPKYTIPDKPGYKAPESVPNETQIVVKCAHTPITMLKDALITTGSVDEGELIGMFEYTKRQATGGAMMLNYLVITPVLAQTKENIAKLREVGSAINLTDAAQKLNACADQVDSGLWEHVNQRMTKHVNNVLINSYGMSAAAGKSGIIDDFAADYEALIQYLKGKDEEVARSFSLYTRFIPQSVCAESEDICGKTILTGILDVSEDEYDQRCSNIVCYEAARSILIANFTLGDMSVVLTKKAQKLDGLAYPALNALLCDSFKASASDTATLYLMTRDRYRIQVIKSPTERDGIFLRLMDKDDV